MSDDCTCPTCAAAEAAECDYAPSVTQEEFDALEWLLDTLAKVHDKGGPNAKKSLLAGRAVIEVMRHAQRLHHHLHELEDRAAPARRVRERPDATLN